MKEEIIPFSSASLAEREEEFNRIKEKEYDE